MENLKELNVTQLKQRDSERMPISNPRNNNPIQSQINIIDEPVPEINIPLLETSQPKLNELKFVQLKKIAKELKIKGRSRMRKVDFINALKKFPDEEIIKLMSKDTINNCVYICIHGKYKYFCRECGGTQICEHNKIKSYCKECKGSQICEHKLQKYICKECKGKGICEHNKQKRQCKECC